MGTSLYSLRKSRHILQSTYKWYKKKAKQLPRDQLTFLESRLQELDQAILTEDREKADALARELEAYNRVHFKKSLWDYLLEAGLALLIALVIATLVRQMWFELYEIPTGSMRPTFKEQDRLTVTKTVFGINYPLETKHLYFDPNIVQRLSVVIWSGDGIPHLDSDSTFLGIFPYTKRFIKRCIGKPEDTLYFYGGKVYGYDRDGNDLVELRNNPWTEKLEYLPFIHFEGRVAVVQEPNKQALDSKIVFHQINQAIGRFVFSAHNFKGEIFNGKEWVKDRADAQKRPHNTIQTYSDFFGIRNFAMARLLTKQQVETLTSHSLKDMEEGVLYLELRHTPSLSSPPPLLNQNGIVLTGYTTLIPLQEEHIKSLMDHMYTARFVVKDGKATRYRQEGPPHFSASSPSFPKVPDGTYEFYYGKAYQIGWGGIAYELSPNHPIYNSSPSYIQKLFNIGIEIANEVAPHNKDQMFFPNRYAYFREGDLYLLGAPIIKKDDPILKTFHEREKQKEEASSAWKPYVAFKDYGPPLTVEGNLDKDFIKTFGFKVPQKHYLLLGDNHAMSQDSRYFGPIPQNNLQGAPSLIIWPPGERWGVPNQKPYPLFTTPRLIVWSIVGLIALIWYIIHRRNLKRPVFKKINVASPVIR